MVFCANDYLSYTLHERRTQFVNCLFRCELSTAQVALIFAMMTLILIVREIHYEDFRGRRSVFHPSCRPNRSPLRAQRLHTLMAKDRLSLT